jgi:hypothetical protein
MGDGLKQVFYQSAIHGSTEQEGKPMHHHTLIGNCL